MDAGGDLRPLTADEAALAARYPLPDGAGDGVLNLAQLAAAFGYSKNTVADWVRKGLPFEGEGGSGRGYAFRLSIAWAWNERRKAEEAAASRSGDVLVAQMQLALLGGETAGAAPDGKMTLAEQRKAIELELVATQLARERGELLRRSDVVSLLEDVGATMRDALDALPDRLARECGLDPRQVEAAVAACDDTMRAVHAAMGELAGDGDQF